MSHTTLYAESLFYAGEPTQKVAAPDVSSIPNDFLMDHELISIFREFNDRIAPTPIRVDMR
jgi:hypothetical protein